MLSDRRGRPPRPAALADPDQTAPSIGRRRRCRDSRRSADSLDRSPHAAGELAMTRPLSRWHAVARLPSVERVRSQATTTTKPRDLKYAAQNLLRVSVLAHLEVVAGSPIPLTVTEADRSCRGSTPRSCAVTARLAPQHPTPPGYRQQLAKFAVEGRGEARRGGGPSRGDGRSESQVGQRSRTTSSRALTDQMSCSGCARSASSRRNRTSQKANSGGVVESGRVSTGVAERVRRR